MLWCHTVVFLFYCYLLCVLFHKLFCACTVHNNSDDNDATPDNNDDILSDEQIRGDNNIGSSASSSVVQGMVTNVLKVPQSQQQSTPSKCPSVYTYMH